MTSGLAEPGPGLRRLLSVLFWSVLSAAFIGPGTVTTAASAGAGHGYALLWALAFSTLACIVLQEAAARLTVASGRDLATALRERHARGAGRVAVLVLVLGAVVLGCAAYEAGNILGGVAGASLASSLGRPVLTLLIGLLAAAVLWFNAPRRVSHLLALLVALMGLAFLGTGILLDPPVGPLLRGVVTPTVPAGAGVLVLALVGTTVVPYNLFLGSGIAAGQSLGELRFGLVVAIALGGVISMGVLVVGAAVAGPFSFEAVADVLAGRLGPGAARLFALGLFAAGLSSAITAPLAAAVTVRSLFPAPGGEGWGARGWRYRSVWLGVLGVGVAFGLSGIRPVPAIVAAQAFNGVVLPAVAVFLLLAMNDARLLGRRRLNGSLANALLGVVTAVTLVLGLAGVARAAATVAGGRVLREGWLLLAAGLVAALLLVPVIRRVRRLRRPAADAGPRTGPPPPRWTG